MKIEQVNQPSLLEYRFESGERVIGSLIELAKYVHPRAGAGYATARTMVPMLSEVLRGKRSGGSELIKAIVQYVSDRTNSDVTCEIDEVIAHFSHRLNAVTTEVLELSARCSKPDVSALINMVANARSIVAVLPSGVFSDDVGRRVLKEFCSRTGLLTDSYPEDGSSIEMKVELWFRDEIRARKWWFLLLDFLAELDIATTEEVVMERIRNRNEGRIIVAACVNRIATGAKVVVGNPTDIHSAVGFGLNISRSGDEVSLSPLGFDGTTDWLEEVYSQINGSDETFEVSASDAFGLNKT